MHIASPTTAQCHPVTYKQVLKLPLLGFIIPPRTAGTALGELCEPWVTTRRINEHGCPFAPRKREGNSQSFDTREKSCVDKRLKRPSQASSTDWLQKLLFLKQGRNHPSLLRTFLREGALVLSCILGLSSVHHATKSKCYHSELFCYLKKIILKKYLLNALKH